MSRQRAIEADLITKQRAQLGKKVIKERKSKVSELSGKPLDGMAEVHHKDRVADKPERAFDPTNLAVIRKDEHSEYHNSDYPPVSYTQLALLLTCGDGEERGEVYGCAADRQQASIVFEVAADMVRTVSYTHLLPILYEKLQKRRLSISQNKA